MKIRARLFVFGVALPACLLAGALFGSGYLFRRELLASVDRELLARAAVESAGAFDGPDAPHLHLGRSTFPPGFVELDPRGTLFDAEGRAVASDPADAPPLAPTLSPSSATSAPTLWTRDTPEGSRRELGVAVVRPSGERYLLRLSCSLGPLERTMTSYRSTTTAFFAVVVLALVTLWSLLARGLSRRLERIAARLPEREDVPAWRPSPGPDDEISALDEALSRAFERLGRARDAQDEFLARAAHELRTPLGVMQAELELGLRRERDAAELRRVLETTRAEVVRLGELATRLLDLTSASRVTLEPEPVDLVRLACESLDAHEGRLEERGLKVRLVTAPASCSADPHLLRLAIDNLVQNAVRHSPDGGALTLEVGRVGDEAVVAVSDRGPGVPEAERERIFEPFSRGKAPRGPGTGLGLAVSRTIARRFGGDVVLAPQEEGARFEVRLPALAAPEAAPRRGRSPHRPA